MEKIKLSIVILTKNSEEVIADCIENIQGFGNEIIVIDSESTDRTVAIAKRLKATVITNPFKDFATQRNFGMRQTRENWVLFLDSDERVTEEFKKEVKHVIETYDSSLSTGGYFIRRKTFFYGIDWGLVDRMQRLLYKPKFVEWKGALHETPHIHGEFGTIQPPILHFTHRNISQMVEKTNAWSDYEASSRFKSNHPIMYPWRFFRVMFTAFLKSYVLEKGFKNGTAGVVEGIYQAFSMFITYAKLWEKQIQTKNK